MWGNGSFRKIMLPKFAQTFKLVALNAAAVILVAVGVRKSERVEDLFNGDVVNRFYGSFFGIALGQIGSEAAGKVLVQDGH